MKKFVYLFSLLFLLTGCVKMFKDEIADALKNMFQTTSPYLDYMPEKTMAGNNTFACYEDGKLVALQGVKQVEGKGGGWMGQYSQAVNALLVIHADSIFQIVMLPQNDGKIFMYSTNIKLGFNRFKIVHDHSLPSEKEYNYYETTDSIDVNITYFDESEHIVCGEFDEIILCNRKNKEDKITITDCWFDVKYGINDWN